MSKGDGVKIYLKRGLSKEEAIEVMTKVFADAGKNPICVYCGKYIVEKDQPTDIYTNKYDGYMHAKCCLKAGISAEDIRGNIWDRGE